MEGESPFQMLNEARTIARAGNYPEALKKFELVIEQADGNEHKLLLAIALSNVAEIHRLQGNTLKALNQFYRALRAYDEIGNQSGISLTRRRIAEIAPTPEREEVETKPEPAPMTSPEKSPVAREKLIRQTIERVRGRVKEQEIGRKKDDRGTLPPKSAPSPVVDGRVIAYNAYVEKVKEGIVGAWTYPKQASLTKEIGRVNLEFTILKDGRLQDVHVARSSGYSSLDREAMRAIESASPFAPIPKKVGLEEISVNFSFNYSLGGKSKSPKP